LKHYSKVLVLSAHPDDLELSCGGTVAKFVNEGVHVDNIILCSNVPHKKFVPTSSKILGFNPIYLEHRDESPTSNVIAEIESTIDMSSYDLLITHWHEDWHQDHRFCHNLGNSLKRNKNFDVWYMMVYPYCQKYKTFESNVYVDVSKYHNQKKDAILAYKNLSKDYVKGVNLLSEYKGMYTGAEKVEVFKLDTLLYG
tara:strand:+ start:190 stop:780 length:591 start_codon:yes stop_codon:yes gene_type:complete